ncbi:hypothetical protein BH23PLA1_BH23PLA1_27270 [soil metagenome]
MSPRFSWRSRLMVLLGVALIALAVGCESSPPGEGVINPSAEQYDSESPALRTDSPGPPGQDANADLEAAVADEVP